MGEKKNRARRGIPATMVVDRGSRGTFRLPSGRAIVVVVPEAMTDADKEMAARALVKLASVIAAALPENVLTITETEAEAESAKGATK